MQLLYATPIPFLLHVFNSHKPHLYVYYNALLHNRSIGILLHVYIQLTIVVLFRLLMVPDMPPKQKRPAPSRGKQPPRKSARSVRPPAKLAQEPDSSEPSSDEAEVDLPLPPISPSPMVAPSQLQNTNQFLLEQIVSTNKRLDELVNRLDKPTPVPSTSAQVPLNPQALLTGALTHFLAEEETLADQALGESDFSSVMILGSTITEKTKALIWANKYVDLSSLMSSKEKNLSVTFDSATNQMIALSTNKPKPIVNIFQWLSCSPPMPLFTWRLISTRLLALPCSPTWSTS